MMHHLYTPSASRPAARPLSSSEWEPHSPREASRQDLQDVATRFEISMVALERRCANTMTAAADKAQACTERVRACARRLEAREVEWAKEKLSLRTELRSIYARYAKTQDGALPGGGDGTATEPHAAEPGHADIVQEYSRMVHSLEATIRRLEGELGAARQEQDETATKTLGFVGDLEAILRDDSRGHPLSPRAAPPQFGDMRKRALERISAFKQAPWQASRPPSQPGLLSPRQSTSRPSSWVPYSPTNGRPTSSASAQGTSEVGEAQLQAGAKRTAALIDQLAKIARRLNENEHLKIFEGVGKSGDGARNKTTVGLVLGSNCTVENIVTGGPAYNSREFSVGDRIVAVDGVPVDSKSVYACMRGSDVVGSPVEVRVAKNGQANAITSIKLTRADADQIADRLEMMELFARLKVQVSVRLCLHPRALCGLIFLVHTPFGFSWYSIFNTQSLQQPYALLAVNDRIATPGTAKCIRHFRR